MAGSVKCGAEALKNSRKCCFTVTLQTHSPAAGSDNASGQLVAEGSTLLVTGLPASRRRRAKVSASSRIGSSSPTSTSVGAIWPSRIDALGTAYGCTASFGLLRNCCQPAAHLHCVASPVVSRSDAVPAHGSSIGDSRICPASGGWPRSRAINATAAARLPPASSPARNTGAPLPASLTRWPYSHSSTA